MPTDKQLAANRANAKRSTGPRTPAGKARAAQNARKHGFAGSDLGSLKIEDREAVDRLRHDLMAVHQPVNSQEIVALERIALAQHTLLRLAHFEAGLSAVALNRALFHFEDEMAFGPLRNQLRSVRLFLRYQGQAEHQYRRAAEEFERLKALREKLQNEAIFAA